MAKKNAMCLELIHSDAAADKAAKRAYNQQYYQTHKQYWKDYYKTGHGIGRPQMSDDDKKKLDDVTRRMEQIKNEEAELPALYRKGIISSDQFDKLLADYHSKFKELKNEKQKLLSYSRKPTEKSDAATINRYHHEESKAMDDFNKYSDLYEKGMDDIASRGQDAALARAKNAQNKRKSSKEYNAAVNRYLSSNIPEAAREYASKKQANSRPYAKVEKKYKKSGSGGKW